MQKVLGFGGFFFRAKDPTALAEWYETHLGWKEIRLTAPVFPGDTI